MSASLALPHSLFFGPYAQIHSSDTGTQHAASCSHGSRANQLACSPATTTHSRTHRRRPDGSSLRACARDRPPTMKSSSQSQSPRTASPGVATAGGGAEHARAASEPWLVAAAAASSSDDSCVNDVDNFARTVAALKSKSAACARPDLLASVLSHYAAKWLPDVVPPSSSASGRFLPPESPTAMWLKKRLLLESLVAALPPDPPAPGCGGAVADDGITCDFLLKLLRAGSTVGADAALLQDLEVRAARRLDQATLGAVMIPAFGHGENPGGSALLLDVPLVLRLVRGFLKEGAAAIKASTVGGGGAAAARVARLVDAYLAEAALEAGLNPAEFEELARAVPAHARPADDALYRAVDTYLKAHPNTGKEERKSLCRLIDARKLTAEAAAHAVQNDRMSMRSVMQVLFSEHGKLSRLAELSASFTGQRSPNPALELPGRCPSKREVLAQHQEVRRLREDVARLQMQCNALQAQVDRLSSERRRRGGGGFFKWSTFWFSGGMGADVARVDDSESGMERRTPTKGKKGSTATATPNAKWRKSTS
ncbi:coleoptile phototropism protein 1-like [Phragmites australis]|uniref:coleoptile phototropism protein 1-like n=1 Tax=Phragmites australis TaxID=29695 RepID=UPI002D782E5F|nr:coleoptile phototropism protein 1-like [Phragmites australis]